MSITIKVVIPKVWQFFPEAPFNWKLLPIDLVNAKGIIKKSPILQDGWLAPAPRTQPVIRVFLLHTEVADKDLCPGTV